jgi:hypothetical protein
MSCQTYIPFENSVLKKKIMEQYKYILNYKCCTRDCIINIQKDIEQLQYLCDDVYSSDDVDEKGLTKNTLCEDLKKYKIYLMKNLENINNTNLLSLNEFTKGQRGGFKKGKKQKERVLKIKTKKQRKSYKHKQGTLKRKLHVQKKGSKRTKRKIKH